MEVNVAFQNQKSRKIATPRLDGAREESCHHRVGSPRTAMANPPPEEELGGGRPPPSSLLVSSPWLLLGGPDGKPRVRARRCGGGSAASEAPEGPGGDIPGDTSPDGPIP